MRPRYESKDDLKAEKVIEDWVSRELDGKRLCKLPIRYSVDFAMVTQNGSVCGWVECKSRKYSWEKIDAWGGYMLSLGKYMAGMNLAKKTGRVFFLIVNCQGDIRYAAVTGDAARPLRIKITGRTDRGDWQDTEPCVMIPVSDFRKGNEGV